MIKYVLQFEALFGTIGSALISLACWYYGVNTLIPVWILFIVVLIAFAIIWGCLIVIAKKNSDIFKPSFKIIKSEKDRIIFQTNLHDCLGVGCFLSFYKKENGFLRFIGVIRVENIQDKLVQGVILHLEGKKKICDEALVIKPVLRAADVHFLNKILSSGEE